MVAAKKGKLGDFAKIAKDFEGWAPAREVLTPVVSVPSIFCQLNAATRVNGWPTQRITLVHGPSNHGKTSLALGLGLSFLRAGHMYFHVDAEMTTPEPWLVELMGKQSENPFFRALRPESYEQTADRVRSAAEMLAEKRDKGQLPEGIGALFVIDSLQRLVPKRLMEKLAKEGGLDGMDGRGAQYMAALNSQWMRELVPLLYHTGSSLLLIGRESENVKAKSRYDKQWKLTGGKSQEYDSSLTCRVTRAWVKRGDMVVGEQHTVEIHKTKIGGRDDKVTRCCFHVSNGKIAPVGYDRARDLYGLALLSGVFAKEGKVLHDTRTGEVVGDENAFVEGTVTDLDELERDCMLGIDVARMEVR